MTERNCNWYDLSNFSKYQINTNGDIRNKATKKQLVKLCNRGGYRCNTLIGDDGKMHYVRNHILVAREFIDNPNNYRVVNHKDGDRSNSSKDNLEWVSHRQNINAQNVSQKIAKAHEIPINEFSNKGIYIRTWKSQKRFCQYYGVTSSAVAAAVDNDNKLIKGRILRTYKGNSDNIAVKTFKGKELDYTIYGEVDKEDLYVPMSTEEILADIYIRQMGTYVSKKQTEKDMAFLKQYIKTLNEKLDRLKLENQ